MAMLLRRRLPLLRLLRQLHTESVTSASSSTTPPLPLQKPPAAASPYVAPGSRRLGFLNATPLASAHGASASSSAAAYLAVGAAAALASLQVAYADGNEQV
jgi:phage-related minor tail protein